MSSNLVAVGKRAFMGCRSLESLFLPLSAVIIRKKAFQSCKKLTIKCERTEAPKFLKKKWSCGRPVLYNQRKAISPSEFVPVTPKIFDTSDKPIVKAPQVDTPVVNNTATIVTDNSNDLA